MDNKDYYICKYINQKISKVGIPYDEAWAIVFCFGLFFIMQHYLLGVITAAIVATGLRKLKAGQGSYYLVVLAYWYLPALKFDHEITFLRKTPPAELRHWI